MLGKMEGKKRREWQRMRWLDSITNSMDTNLSKLCKRTRTGKPSVLHSMGSERVGHDLATEQEQQNSLGRQVSCWVVCSIWYIFSFKKTNDSPWSSAVYESVQSGLNWPCRLSVWVIFLSWPFLAHVWMWELDHKESWVLKNWCF